MLVSRSLATRCRVGIASGCEDKRVGAALVTSHELLRSHQLQVLVVEVTSASHPDARMREWERLVGGSLGSDAQPHTSSLSWPSPHTSSSSSIPHALVIPPLCRRHCHPRDTCPTKASSSSGGDVTVVVRPRPCIVGEWEGRVGERASSLSHCRLSVSVRCRRMGGERALSSLSHRCPPVPSSSSSDPMPSSSSGGGIAIAICPRPCVVGEWEGREGESVIVVVLLLSPHTLIIVI